MTTSAADPTATEHSATWRVAPSVPVAIGVFVAYVVVFIGLACDRGDRLRRLVRQLAATPSGPR